MKSSKKGVWTFCAALIGVTVLVGCASLDSTAGHDDILVAIDTARAKISHTLVLDDASKSLLTEPPANYGYYKLGGNYYDYSFRWNISSDRVVSVTGRGNLKTLENCVVSVGPSQH